MSTESSVSIIYESGLELSLNLLTRWDLCEPNLDELTREEFGMPLELPVGKKCDCLEPTSWQGCTPCGEIEVLAFQFGGSKLFFWTDSFASFRLSLGLSGSELYINDWLGGCLLLRWELADDEFGLREPLDGIIFDLLR